MTTDGRFVDVLHEDLRALLEHAPFSAPDLLAVPVGYLQRLVDDARDAACEPGAAGCPAALRVQAAIDEAIT